MGSSPKKDREEVKKVESNINEVFEPFFSIFGFESVKEEGFPVIDVFENSENIFVEAELPGMDRDRVNISMVEGRLVIEGEKVGDRYESENVRYLCIERNFGKFRRTVEIPSAADTGKITARYREGILRVTIPKVREQRRKRMRIEIE